LNKSTQHEGEALSYVVQIWAQPPGEALPTDAQEIWASLPGLHRRPNDGDNRFDMLARGMQTLYPELAADDADEDFWIDDLQQLPQGSVWNLGLYCGERHGVVRTHLIKYALKFGLNVADEQSGELFLADGRSWRQGQWHRSDARPAPERARRGGAATSPPAPVRRASQELPPPKSPGAAWHHGHLSLLLGLMSPVLLLTLAPLLPALLLRITLAAFCLASAYGVWRCSHDMGWGLPRRAISAALALVPFVALVPATHLAILVLRSRRE
jgi:hypothetical protein